MLFFKPLNLIILFGSLVHAQADFAVYQSVLRGLATMRWTLNYANGYVTAVVYKDKVIISAPLRPSRPPILYNL